MIDIVGPSILVTIIPLIFLFLIFVLSVLYHWRKKDYEGKSELFDKSMMTCLKSLIVLMVVG
ncbi:MAG: hypothetical protein ACW975_06960, partial [Candidatus Thorarchaeota archaeon]